MKHKVENRLKSFLKKNVRITEGLIVVFLITGSLGYGATEVEKTVVTAPMKVEDKVSINSMSEETKKKLEKEIIEELKNSKIKTNENFIVLDRINKYNDEVIKTKKLIDETAITDEADLIVVKKINDYYEKDNKVGMLLSKSTFIGINIAGLFAILDSSDSKSSSDNNLGEPEGPGESKLASVWVDGIKNANSKYILTEDMTTTSYNHGLRADGAENSVTISSGTTLTVKPSDVYQSSSQTEGVVDYETGSILLPELSEATFGVVANNGAYAENNGEIKLENNGSYLLGGMLAGIDSIVLNKGVISGDGSFGMVAIGSNSVATNLGEVSTIGDYGMSAINEGIVTNGIGGAIKNTGGYGMSATGIGSEALNAGEVSNTRSYGMEAEDGGLVTNTVGGVVKNIGAFGMSAIGVGSEALNAGEVSNTDNFGMFATNGGLVTNAVGGVVKNIGAFGMSAIGIGSEALNAGEVSNTRSYGMQGLYGGIITNAVGGVVKNDGVYGMHARGVGSEALNAGEVSNTDNFGMFAANGGLVTNAVGGIVKNTGDYGMYAELDSEAINIGEISNTGDYGMFAENGGLVTNAAGGVIKNTGDYGMSATGIGSEAINSGEISNTGDYGMYALNGGLVINTVGGTIKNTRTYGMSATGIGSEALNAGEVSNTRSNGMEAFDGGLVTNTVGGVVKNSSSVGMESFGIGSEALNAGEVSNTNNFGMFAANGGLVTNAVGGVVKNTGEIGMYATGIGSEALNAGEVSNTNTFGMYALDGGAITNTGVVKNDGSYGMYARKVGSEALNLGEISNTGNYGMEALFGGLVTNAVGGVVKNLGFFGMRSNHQNSEAINLGEISNTGDYGMFAENEGLVTNAAGGVISNTGDYGMYATGIGSEAINNGIILNGGPNKGGSSGGGIFINNNPGNTLFYSKYSDRKEKVGTTWFSADGEGSTTINNGVMDLNGISATGMVATNGGTIINRGTVNLNADKGTGMSVKANSMAINEGIINLNSTNGIGIHISGDNAIVQNNGSIFISGVESTSEIADSNGNRAMAIDAGTSFVNNGQFVHTGDLDTREMGAGDFVLAGGTVEAKSIRGDFKASGALTMGGYKDEYNTYRMFKTENMYASIGSNAAMFDAKLRDKDSNGYYGIDMIRKDFNDIIDNSSYGEYLENNYNETNSTIAKNNLYDSYKLIRTEERLNQEVNETFGNTIYPSFMYQTLGMIRNNNQSIKENVFTPANEDIRYIGFANYKNLDISLDGDATDYKVNSSSVSLGFDRLVSTGTRLGLVGTLGKADYNFDGPDSRKDDFYQLNAIGSYEKNDVKATATAYIGRSSGDLERTLSLSTINEKMDGNLKNNYYGLDLSVEKKYTLDKFNLTPKFELNTVNIQQDSVQEKGDYGLDVDGINSTSMESGLGLKIDKTFVLNNGIKITPEVSAMYYRELLEPYKSTDAVLTSVSTDKVKIDSYKSLKDRGVFDVAFNIEKNSLQGRIGVQYKIDDQVEEITPYIGLGYKF